jgi:uncharacterized repeat protein (TIGR01451 family)
MRISVTQIKLPALLAALVIFGAAGCARWSQPAAPGAAPAVKLVSAETTAGGIRFHKTLPADVAAGGDFSTELTLTAQQNVTNVVVRDTIPAGATYLRSEPAAEVGDELVWKLGDFTAAQVVKIKVWFQAGPAGPPSSFATITAGPQVSASVAVGKPMLMLEQTGPDTAMLGAEVAYHLVIKNIGSSSARGVAVRNPVPAGMSHSSAKPELLIEMGDLSPGQSKLITVALKANQRGKVCSVATVTSANTPAVTKEVCTLILVPSLKVEKTGTKEQIIGRNADYEITVVNAGDTTLRNVLLTDVTPPECAIVAAPGAIIAGNKATWTIAELKPGAKATETIKLTAKVAGASCNTVTASVGVLTDSAKACTQWKGVPAVTFELTDNPDPIQIGESSTYTIKVINQGSGEIHNVKVVATFDATLLPISSPQGNVGGQRVIFPTVASIAPKQSVTYTIAVKGTAVGDSRNKVELSCDELKAPVIREESTIVY